jgi:hypothetical protein
LPAEQARDGELSDALATLRHKVEEAFEATGRVVEDGAVRADVREVARLLGDAVTETLSRRGNDIRPRLDHVEPLSEGWGSAVGRMTLR